MNSLPLHPAIVHIPLGLALIMPLLAAGFAWAIWTGRFDARAWLAVLALQGLLVASSLVAINTGSSEEERVEPVVPEAALHQHEEYAEQFAWAAGGACVLSAMVLLGRRTPVSHVLTAGSVAASVIVAGLAIRTGHAGGQLVYSHNAGAAYVRATTPALGAPVLPDRDSGGDKDDRRTGAGRER